MISKVKIILIAVMFISVVCAGCYAGITGKVIDAETQQPIEGAVVLVEWTKTKGFPGMSHTESAKVIEVVSDKDGKVEIAGNFNPLVDPPHVTVYKKGYVAWNNEYIFPDYKKRTDFKWKSGYEFRLERYKDGYSHNDHVSFIRSSIGSSQNLEAKGVIYNAFEWERIMAQQERINRGLSP
jgi:hypothetical protein